MLGFLFALALALDRTMIHLNHAGASPSPPIVLDTVNQHLKSEQKIGGYTAAAQAPLHSVHESIRQLLGASSTDQIALTESATMSWNRLFTSTMAASDGTTILVSQAEYAASLVVACEWTRFHPECTLLQIPSDDQGRVDVNALDDMLEGKHRLVDGSILDPSSIAVVCVAHVPTNSGIVNPIVAIGERLLEQQPSIYYLVDACQSVGHIPLDVKAIHCHGLVGTGRKYLRGPRGTGFLYCAEADDLWPAHPSDHFALPIASVPPQSRGEAVEKLLEYAPRSGARRFELWESNVAARLGLGAAVDYYLQEDRQARFDRILSLARHAYKRLGTVPSIRRYYEPMCGIVTFWVEGMSAEVVHAELLEQNYELSVVPATSTPLDSSRTGVPNMVRASVSYTTTMDELDGFVEALRSIVVAVQL